MAVHFAISGYGKRARDGRPFHVVQTGERIASPVPAKAIKAAEESRFEDLLRLARRSNLSLSTPYGSWGGDQTRGNVAIGYGSARLGELVFLVRA